MIRASEEAQIIVGKKIQISRDERRLLEEFASINHRLIIKQDNGWLEDFVRNVTAQNKIIREMLSRAHAPRG